MARGGAWCAAEIHATGCGKMRDIRVEQDNAFSCDIDALYACTRASTGARCPKSFSFAPRVFGGGAPNEANRGWRAEGFILVMMTKGRGIAIGAFVRVESVDRVAMGVEPSNLRGGIFEGLR